MSSWDFFFKHTSNISFENLDHFLLKPIIVVFFPVAFSVNFIIISTKLFLFCGYLFLWDHALELQFTIDNQQVIFAGILTGPFVSGTISIEIKGEENHVSRLQ